MPGYPVDLSLWTLEAESLRLFIRRTDYTALSMLIQSALDYISMAPSDFARSAVWDFGVSVRDCYYTTDFTQLVHTLGWRRSENYEKKRCPRWPKAKEKGRVTPMRAPTRLPSVTGRRFRSKKVPKPRGAPFMRAAGTRNMLATVCSSESATKALRRGGGGVRGTPQRDAQEGAMAGAWGGAWGGARAGRLRVAEKTEVRRGCALAGGSE